MLQEQNSKTTHFDWDNLKRQITDTNSVRLRIDVGLSYKPPNAIEWLKTCKDTLIIAVEPVYSSFESTKNHLIPLITSTQGRNNILILINAALDNIDDCELRTINISNIDPGASSLFEISNNGDVTHSHEEIIQVLSFKKLLDQIDWKRYNLIDYLKLDTQGKDLDIMKSCEPYHDKIQLLEIETTTNNCYHGAPNQQEIVDYLKNSKFEFVRYSGDLADHVYRYKR